MSLSFSIKRRSTLPFCDWGLYMFTYHFESTGLLSIKFALLLTLYHISNTWSDCACLFIYPKYLLKMFGSRAFSLRPVLYAPIFTYKAVQYLSRRQGIIFYTIWIAIVCLNYALKTLLLLILVVPPPQKKTQISRNVYKVVMRQKNNRYRTRTKKGGDCCINKTTY